VRGDVVDHRCYRLSSIGNDLACVSGGILYRGVCRSHIELAGAPSWALPEGSVSDLRVAMVPNHGSWISNM
jgi:hypothetical protein